MGHFIPVKAPFLCQLLIAVQFPINIKKEMIVMIYQKQKKPQQ